MAEPSYCQTYGSSFPFVKLNANRSFSQCMDMGCNIVAKQHCSIYVWRCRAFLGMIDPRYIRSILTGRKYAAGATVQILMYVPSFGLDNPC